VVIAKAETLGENASPLIIIADTHLGLLSGKRFYCIPNNSASDTLGVAGFTQWLIGQKVMVFSRLLVGRTREVDFTKPMPNLERSDSLNNRKRILQSTQEKVRGRGIGRSTLHYLRRHAQDERSFRISRKVKEKIEISSEA
jgi:hypothetical protein